MESDKVYSRRIQQMCAFILQEATEKATEINVKGEHDFNLQKQMIVHQSKLKLNQEFLNKKKELETSDRVKRARFVQKCRAQKMVSREQLLQVIKDEAVDAIVRRVQQDGAQYKETIKNLMVQGLIKINERKVVVCCRKVDETLVKGLIPEAVAQYKALLQEACGEDIPCELELNANADKYLPPPPTGDGGISCAGGVRLEACHGRIVCDNTLDSRLSIAFQDLQPYIRNLLFPAN